MSETKKTKREPTTPAALAPIESAWAAVMGLADDARAELHRQAGAFIGVADGAVDGATRYAVNLTDRVNQVARDTLAAADHTGRQLATAARASVRGVVSSTRESAQQIAQTTRGAAERASATARALVGPAEAKAA